VFGCLRCLAPRDLHFCQRMRPLLRRTTLPPPPPGQVPTLLPPKLPRDRPGVDRRRWGNHGSDRMGHWAVVLGEEAVEVIADARPCPLLPGRGSSAGRRRGLAPTRQRPPHGEPALAGGDGRDAATQMHTGDTWTEGHPGTASARSKSHSRGHAEAHAEAHDVLRSSSYRSAGHASDRGSTGA